jgi:hypothetical protein
MRPKGSVLELVDSGQYILATNPYTSGKLASTAREHGFRIRSPTIVRRNAPWSKARLYLHGMSKKQLERIAKFIETIIEGREAGEIGEGKPAPVYIRKKFGIRKPRVYVSKAKPMETLRKELAKIREAIEKAPVVATAPTAGRVLE